MDDNSTITFVNTLDGEGNNRLIILEGKQGGLQPLPDNSDVILTQNNFFTGKNLFANSESDEPVDIIPLCTKELRMFVNGASKANMLNATAQFVSLRSPSSANNILITLPPDLGNPGDVLTDLLGDGVLTFQASAFGPGLVETAIPFTTDNALVRVDLTSGTEHVQESTILLDDTDNLTGVTSITLDENVLFSADPGFTSYGFDSASSRTTATGLCAVGLNAAGSVTDSANITCFGQDCGASTNIATSTFYGSGCGQNTTTGTASTAYGFHALANHTQPASAGRNNAFGNNALNASVDTFSTCAFGDRCLELAVDGGANCSYGSSCMRSITGGNNSCGYGANCLVNLVNTTDMCAYGNNSLLLLTGGTGSNTAYGKASGSALLTGNDNCYFGKNSGLSHNAAQSNNVCISSDGLVGDSGVIHIGRNGTQTSAFIQGIWQVTPGGATEMVIIDSNGEIGSVASGGAGDVSSNVGTAVVGQVALFADTTGKLITTGQITMSGSGKMTEVVTMEMDHTATVENDHALEIDVNADGFGDVQGILIEYTTGAITSLQDEECILVNIDETAALGGRVVALEVLATEGLAEVDALECGVGCHPIRQQSGTFADADFVFVLAVDESTDLSQGGAGLIDLFVGNGDTVTVQSATKFSEIEMLFDTLSSNPGIDPLFEYSDGASPTTWATFSPADGTNQCRTNGIILWELVDIPLWVTATSGLFEIRITRQRMTISTKPVGKIIQIAVTSIYTWNSDGDLTIKGLNVSTSTAGVNSVVLEGTGVASGLNADFTGFVDIDSSLANTQAIKIIASNAAGGLLIQSNTGGSEYLSSGSVDIVTSVDSAGIGIKLRATGTQGQIEFDAGSGGVRIVDGGVGLFLDDSGSAFSQQIKMPTFTGDLVWTLPDAQGAASSFLQNNGSGILSWAGGGSGFDVIRQWGSNDMINSTSSSFSVTELAPSIPDPSFDALSVREYDQTTSQGVGLKLTIPAGTVSIDVRIAFRRSSAAGGSIAFDLLAYALDSTVATSGGTWNLANEIYNATPASTEVVVKVTQNFTLIALGLSADEDCMLQIIRDIADTYTAPVYLLSCEISVG